MAVGDAYVFPGFLTPVLTLLFFQSHRLLFSHASAEVRGENTPERKVASTWDRTHNHQVMSPTRSPLSHPGGLSNLKIINSLPNDNFVDWSKLKALEDDKIKLAEKLKFVLGRVENIVGKGENAGYQHFLLFPQCFQKACILGSLKVGIVW